VAAEETARRWHGQCLRAEQTGHEWHDAFKQAERRGEDAVALSRRMRSSLSWRLTKPLRLPAKLRERRER
jgi:hypothetical protein